MPAAALLPVLAAISLSGCATRLGPGAIRSSHRPYNDSVVETLNEQLLLNLVRLKYRDNPYFIEVSSITSQQTFEGTVAATGRLPFLNSKLRDIGPAASAFYSDNPIVTFQPLQGEKFLQKLMAPIPFEALLQLTQSGWSVSRVMRIGVEQANHLHNAPSASGPTPDLPPEYQQFKAVALELRRLQQTHGIDLVLDGDRVAMTFDRSRISVSDSAKACSMLGISNHSSGLLLTATPSRSLRSGELYLQTRSLIGILFFLSHNVEVPAADEEKGLVTVTRYPDGERFDWNDVSGDLLRVNYSPTPPTNAFVKIKYRNNWFYIADNDLDSKSTFMLLNQLFNLLAGDVNKAAPAFTIPLG